MGQQRASLSGLGVVACLVGFCIVVALVGVFNSRSKDSNNSTANQQVVVQPTESRIQTTENRLAELDAGHSVSDNDPTVIKFRRLLKELTSKTETSEQDIMISTVRGQKILFEDYHKRLSLLELMDAVNQSIPDTPSPTMKYHEALSLFIAYYVASN